MKKSTKKFHIIRTYSAGVWFGNIKKLDGTTVILQNARRLWYWSGAASLSQLAIEGTKRPNDCKFTMTITDDEGVYLPQVIEVLPCTEEAVNNIKSVKEWKL
ncbi:hypothetical protein J2X97_000374 [Epilithonimonas hungarica]|uniref:DUF6948 domain-containing protein n=1 Tax=Epilithonimonas hungarica TaxID=454006 RepID=UPI002788BD07|nr:hypothetical protein [Epilithonimonas hungarica]MDP9954737.1 hypothetical protein [Epilithonimonas hungarica]